MSSWDQANRGEKNGLFGEIEGKLAKLLMTTFTYRSPLNYFMLQTTAYTLHMLHLLGGSLITNDFVLFLEDNSNRGFLLRL